MQLFAPAGSGRILPSGESPVRGAPASDAQYFDLLRAAAPRWWHPLAGAVVLLLAWAIPSGALTELLSAVAGADTTRPESAADVLALSLTIALLIPAAVVAVVLVHRARPGVLLSVTRRPRAGLFFFAAGIASVALVPMTLAKTAGFDAGPDSTSNALEWVGWQSFLPFLAVVVLVFPLQAAAEEIVFRGYLTQALATWTRHVWLAVLGSSLLFVAIHNIHDGWSFADRLFFAFAMCWLTWRTGGLEAAIAVHVVYNVLLGLATGATGRLGSMVNAGESEPAAALTSMGGTALAAWTVAWWAQSQRVARTAAEGEEAHR